MLVTTADHWDPRPGTVISWRVTPRGTAEQDVRLSTNQRNHVAGCVGGEPSVWLAATFDVDGPIDVEALEAAYRTVVSRHSALQSGATVDGAGVRGVRLDPGALEWTTRIPIRTVTVRRTRRHIRSWLDQACSPLSYPAFWPGAISRPDRSTVIFGLDHLHGDAYSLAVLIDDLHTLYDGFAGHQVEPRLPEAGCFVMSEAAPAAPVADDDPRLVAWQDFLQTQGHRLPTFPLGLGLEIGERASQRTEVRRMIDGPATAAVAHHAQRHGASTCGAVLASLALAVRDIGGPELLAVLVPVHTRRTEADRRAVGWYTATTPVEVAAHSDPCAALLEGARALAAGRGLAEVPLEQVMAAATSPLVRERNDVFMLSYLDYRRLPGSAEFARRDAQHVSSPTRADDVQLWISRTDGGLAVRARLPATRTSRRIVDRLLRCWEVRLEALAVGCDHPPVRAGTSDRSVDRRG